MLDLQFATRRLDQQQKISSMTSRTTRRPVLNSLLYVRDSKLFDLPEIDGKSGIWLTPSCIAVSCLPDCDGETVVTIGSRAAVGRSSLPLFNGWLETPSGRVIVEGVLGNKILEHLVPSRHTRVQVWTNGFRDTDEVAVALE
jgi:hypothetical protein